MLDGTERLGVVAVFVDGDAQSLIGGRAESRLQSFVSLLGELVMTKTLYGDTIVRLRRLAQMGLAGEMQWSLLPPLTLACAEVTIAAALEPAYEVAGDTVDYAVDAGVARFAVLDGMGRGLRSAQSAVLAVAAYRHARRAARRLRLAVYDGVTEARSPSREFFGEQRVVDLIVRQMAAGLPAPETMRRVVRALLEHEQGGSPTTRHSF